FLRAKIEPDARRRGEREYADPDTRLVHIFDGLGLGPRDLAGEMRNLARVFPAKPELLVLRRVEMVVGIDESFLVSGRRRARQHRRGSDGSRAGEELTARGGWCAASAASELKFGHGVSPNWRQPGAGKWSTVVREERLLLARS